MNAVLLIVSVGVEYPALLSTVDCVGFVGFILRLKAQVFSLSLYNECNDVHADYNAAKNIGLNYLRDQQQSGRGGAPVGVRLNSGTLNVNGEYSPTALSG